MLNVLHVSNLLSGPVRIRRVSDLTWTGVFVLIRQSVELFIGMEWKLSSWGGAGEVCLVRRLHSEGYIYKMLNGALSHISFLCPYEFHIIN